MASPPVDFSNIKSADVTGVGIGISGIVLHIKGTNVAVKTFPPLDKNQDSERKIYEHLQLQKQSHPNVLRYFGRSPPECEILRQGLLLEYHPRGILAVCLDKLDDIGVTEAQGSCWPRQVISAVEYIHAHGVIHGDLGLHNLLIHNDGRLILCDFAGSGMEGGPQTIACGSRYQNPKTRENSSSTQEDDVFALGTILYELDCGEQLFKGQTSWEIMGKLEQGQFPDLSMVPLPMRSIIHKCWKMSGYRASDALEELGTIDVWCMSPFSCYYRILEIESTSLPRRLIPHFQLVPTTAIISTLAAMFIAYKILKNMRPSPT